MPTSYPQNGARVNTPASKSSARAASPAPRSNRNTATFTPYYWEAYNQITQPHRWDWYLIDRWLPDLGPEGFTIVKVLRALCYFNPNGSHGAELRDTCQISVDELAAKCGMKRSKFYEVLKNPAVAAFVQRIPDVVYVEGRTRRLPPQFRVCMDCPIHPSDMEEYDRLRGKNEMQRAVDEEEERKSKIRIYEQRKSTIDGRKSRNDERKSATRITTKEDTLPSGSLLIDSLHAEDGVDAPPINSPKGGEDAASGAEIPDRPVTLDPLVATWNVALSHLAGRASKPALGTHLRQLRLVSISPTGDVTIAAPSEFTRSWVTSHHQADIEAALAEALGSPPASVHIMQEAK